MTNANDHVLQSFEVFFFCDEIFPFENLDRATVVLIEKILLFPQKYWLVAGIWLFWKLKEHTNDHKSIAPTSRTF